MLNHFYGWKILFVNPAYKIPRFTFFIGTFLNFQIKKSSLCVFDHFWEHLLVINILRGPIFHKGFVTIKVSPAFGMFSDVDDFGVFHPH